MWTSTIIKALADKCCFSLIQTNVSPVWGPYPKEWARWFNGAKRKYYNLYWCLFLSHGFKFIFLVYVMSHAEALKHSHNSLIFLLWRDRSLSPPPEFEYTCINRVWQREDCATSQPRSCSLHLVCWNTCPGNPEPPCKKSKYLETTMLCGNPSYKTPWYFKRIAEPSLGTRCVSKIVFRWFQQLNFLIEAPGIMEQS